MAHGHTIFQQRLKMMPRHQYARLEAERGTGRQARSFGRCGRLVHLLSVQIVAPASLRDGVASLKARLEPLPS